MISLTTILKSYISHRTEERSKTFVNWKHLNKRNIYLFMHLIHSVNTVAF